MKFLKLALRALKKVVNMRKNKPTFEQATFCCILCASKRKRKQEKIQKEMNELLDINKNGMLIDEKAKSCYCGWIDNTMLSEKNERKRQYTGFKH